MRMRKTEESKNVTFTVEASFVAVAAHVSAAAGFSCIALNIPILQ